LNVEEVLKPMTIERWNHYYLVTGIDCVQKNKKVDVISREVSGNANFSLSQSLNYFFLFCFFCSGSYIVSV
jgi:hypothetical protein